MPRIILGFACVLAAGLIVAFVNGQETFRRPNTPTLAKPPVRSADASTSNSATTNATKKRTSLAERLQGIRRSVTNEHEAGLADPSPTPAPAPAAPEPSRSFQPVEEGDPEEPDVSSRSPSVLRRQGVVEEARTPRIATQPPADTGTASSRRPDRATPSALPSLTKAAERGPLFSGEAVTVSVDCSGPPAVLIGKEAVYTLNVANKGDSPAKSIFLRVDLPPWVQLAAVDPTSGAIQRPDPSLPNRVVWVLEQVAARGQDQLQLRLVPQQNRAFDLAVEWSVKPQASFAQIDVLQPLLKMALAGPKEILYGETRVYTITLANPGTGDAENVIVDLAPGQIGSEPRQLGTIPAGQQKQIEVELTARQAGAVEIRAAAAGEGGLQAQITEQIVVRRATLEAKVVGPRLKYAGTRGTYQVRVANVGDATATNVGTAFLLPSGLKYVGGLEGGNTSGRTLNWSVGNLEPGAERVFDIQCEMVAAGEHRIELRAQADGELTAHDVAATTVEALADLKLAVNDPQGPQPVGQPVSYELIITNRGTKSAEQISILAQFSEGVEPTKAEGWRAEIVPGQVLFQPIPRIDAGQSLTVKVFALAEREGAHRFRAEVKCTDPDSRLISESTTRFFGDNSAGRAAAAAARSTPPVVR